jgi:hypothetical protein
MQNEDTAVKEEEQFAGKGKDVILPLPREVSCASNSNGAAATNSPFGYGGGSAPK